MQPSVLIVEDEQGSARLIASLCEEVGLGSRHTRSGREALDLLKQAALAGQPFACVVLDIVIEEMDGFQVAQSVRAEAYGAELPIIVLSGVYKQLPQEFAARVRPAAFMPKPFEPSQLREALRRFGGVEAPAPVEANIAAEPALAVCVELLRQKASGVLTLTSEQVVRKLYFQAGQIRFAQSNVKSETAGAAQVASGQIKQASFDRAVALARQQKIALHEALAAARVLTLEQLKAALKQQTQDVAMGGFALTAGTHRFEPLTLDQVNHVPDARVSPVTLVLEQARREEDPGAARRWLEAHAQDRLSRSPELEREMFALKASWPGESVTALAAGGRTVGEILARVKEGELALLAALCRSTLVQLARPGGVEALARATAAAASLDEDRGKRFSPKEEDARRQLLAELLRLKDASHYELLGVAPDADAAAIKLAYFRAAKRYHSDTFSGLELGSARRAAEELFARVNEANEVLGAPQKRAEYDVFLDRKRKGLPTDVAAILKAESVFQKGELFFKAGKWEDAEAAFREAVSLNHAEADFHAYLGMALFRGRGKAAEGYEHVEKALDLDPRSVPAQRFAAALKHEQGDSEAAKKILRKLLEQDPNNPELKAELNRIKAGKRLSEPNDEGKKGGGFFSRLLKKS